MTDSGPRDPTREDRPSPRARNSKHLGRPATGLSVAALNTRRQSFKNGSAVVNEIVNYMTALRSQATALQEIGGITDTSVPVAIDGGFTLIVNGPGVSNGTSKPRDSTARRRAPAATARSRTPARKPPSAPKKWGCTGVLLSPNATRRWDGAKVTFGDRIVAVRVKLPTKHGRFTHLCIASCCAPHSGCRDADHTRHHDHLAELITSAKATDYLVVGSDANAQIGVRGDTDCRVLGPHGISTPQNRSGARLYQVLATTGQCAAGSFFDKGPSPRAYAS